ncbi:hypothetical protein DXM27_24525 [Rhizobium rhizogenes]|uniref:Apea-like HEPN domain-containing protein n=1 Tax=Rhizobium rhizogenes TaxID=359 RepID=A0AA88EW32_RHIRH|nr:hypothetical protein [Rhizobium rhizogenes]KAA3497917.1 hypothetical protein DXM27_24525 [Rhizobium rhizogenes]KAA3521727.1 hypothetical protein DXM29_23645 [Agrobacterium tumefaciens]
MTEKPPDEITIAVASLWKRRFPDPENSYQTPEFLALKAACVRQYPVRDLFWFTTALWEILRSIGCPMLLRARPDLALPSHAAAELLHSALTSKTDKIVHLCPLDWADDIPRLQFGSSQIGRFTASELQTFADAPRLARAFPTITIDWERLSQFHWLVVTEEVPISVEPGQRTMPDFYGIHEDLGAIVAHEDHFPKAVEQALMALLLAPWEEWSVYRQMDWRGFHLPWIFSRHGDLCVRLKTPPQDKNLTWLPQSYTDAYGDQVEVEEPAQFRLEDEAETLADFLSEERWGRLERALTTTLFETPVRHFFNRAFHSAGIDEFIAHLTVIEAALGLHSDYGKKPKSDPRKAMTVTQVMRTRVQNLLGDPKSGGEYELLFDLRSAYVHGRSMAPISSEDRRRARRLARAVVLVLVDVASSQGANIDREMFLNGLLSPQV